METNDAVKTALLQRKIWPNERQRALEAKKLAIKG